MYHLAYKPPDQQVIYRPAGQLAYMVLAEINTHYNRIHDRGKADEKEKRFVFRKGEILRYIGAEDIIRDYRQGNYGEKQEKKPVCRASQ